MKIVYRKGLLRFCEVWFNELPQQQAWQAHACQADVLVFHESRVAVSARSSPFRNGVLTLDKDLNTLFGALNSGFRNEVRRAEKEGIAVSVCAPVDGIDRIYPAYRKFCQDKHIGALARQLLGHYARAGRLFLSEASIGGAPVQAHLYFADAAEAILLASFPLPSDAPRKLVGWANRALHWADIKAFKERGVLRYNLGGMGNPVTEQTLSIVAFKNEMNPTEVMYYQDMVPVSLQGKCYFLLKKFLR